MGKIYLITIIFENPFMPFIFKDDSNGVRLYTTEEDEVNCESWRLLAG